MLQKAELEPSFYKSLEEHIQKRKHYVQPEFELNSIKAVLNRLIK
jgi:hypothetical protein